MDICESYQRKLSDAQISPPLAAILALTELCAKSKAGTMAQLSQQLDEGAELLKKSVSNPISLTAGCELFIAFVTYFPHDAASFSDLKMELVRQGETYVQQVCLSNLAVDFIKDDAVILTHSHSRVVMETLLLAHRRNKRVSVYVTEARPRGLGIKTAEALTAAGISCTVVLDSAVSYIIDKIDFVLVGSEAVVESGGLVNAVGSLNIAVIAKAANKPLYALAESYKFHRLFPLSSDDLPSHNPRILSFTSPVERAPGPENTSSSASPVIRAITQESIAQNNPDVDFTRPDLISLVFSDLGSLTPSGVSQYLVGMFAGPWSQPPGTIVITTRSRGLEDAGALGPSQRYKTRIPWASGHRENVPLATSSISLHRVPTLCRAGTVNLFDVWADVALSLRINSPTKRSNATAPSANSARTTPRTAQARRAGEWLFPLEALHATPSAWPLQKELYDRARGIEFLFRLGSSLFLPTSAILTAAAWFHRFYMRFPMEDYHRQEVAASCIFLATKTEECGRKLQALLEALCFDYVVESPHSKLVDLIEAHGQEGTRVAEVAWSFAHDSFRTTLCLHYSPQIIAAACYVLAQRVCDGPNSNSLDARIASSAPRTSLPTPPTHKPASPDAARFAIEYFAFGESELACVAESLSILLEFYRAQPEHENLAEYVVEIAPPATSSRSTLYVQPSQLPPPPPPIPPPNPPLDDVVAARTPNSSHGGRTPANPEPGQVAE
uniref:Translation initiation factor eIF2B subunit alpha n=1 Tax=Mycena chlorophos TaxID=658473 RepID=A0ABQ0M5T5_MYCCL|nr:translation initiation factor eIF-2B subunit alpha [Mycena chlorophos]